MRSLVLAAAGLLIVTLAMTAAPRPATACSCAGLTLEEYAADVTLAFTGTQIERAPFEGQFGGGAHLTFEVDQVHAGAIGPTVTARTEGDSAGCGVDFGGQGRVAVVAFGPPEEPSVDLCGSPVSEADLEAVFGPGADPDPAVVDAAAPAVDGGPDVDNDDDGGGGGGGGVPWLPVLGLVVAALAVAGLFLAGTVRLGTDGDA